MKKDWTKFTKRVTINSTARSIYNAWAIPAEIENWFLSSAEYTTADGDARTRTDRVKTGDRYTWRWYGFPGGAAESGRVIEANGYNSFRFTFTDNCIVDVAILPEKNEKLVQLTQKKIAPDEQLKVYLGCGEGWTFYLANLKSYLEGGIDLRNKNDKIRGVINS